MIRLYHTFEIIDVNLIKQQMLRWATRFSICCFLDSQQYQLSYSSFDCILAVGSNSVFKSTENFFPSLSSFLDSTQDWVFAHFNYELNNGINNAADIEDLSKSGFPDYFLFVPQTVIILKGNKITIGVIEGEPAAIFAEVSNEIIRPIERCPVAFNNRITREQYLKIVRHLKEHIQKGDCYEINYCQEFYASAIISPISVYLQLAKTSPSPFSAFYRNHHNYLLSSSPERYVKKIEDKIISQPIKGTSARDHGDLEKDDLSKTGLSLSKKDQMENVMVVDLVRNDLSKICKEGTVEVEELFGVYSFPHVHQMISTIVGSLDRDKNLSNVLQSTFPMGSMTGAPKKKVMELIARYEAGKRGIYSGTVGYITPEKNFDFNVVIRSIVYNEATNYISFHTGSAITASSDPEDEYEECLLKAKPLLDLFPENKKGDK